MDYKERLKSVLNSVVEGASYRVFVANNSINRKVLIVADEPSIKNLLGLLRRLENRRMGTAGARPGLSTISRRSFDTAILDLRCSPRRPDGRGYGIGEVWPSMVGRVLVINAEINDQKTFGLVEKYIHQRHTLRDLLLSLTTLARTVFGRSPSPHRI